MEKINYSFVEELSKDFDILNQMINTSSALYLVKGIANIIPNQKMLINTLGIQESKGSNAIENIITTDSDLFETMALKGAVNNVNAKEVLNYCDAVILANESIKERPISKNLLEAVQEMIEENKSGVRKVQVHIGNAATGEIIHMPPKADELEELLSDLVKFINSDHVDTHIHPLINVIVTHQRFESIHPFLDGNGRTGRILIMTQLVQYGYLELPIIYLSRYINQTRNEYYKHLRCTGKCNYEAWKEFILYYLNAMEITALAANQLIKDIASLIAEIKVQLLDIPFKRNADSRLIDLLFIHPYFTRETYEEYLNIKKVTAVKDINLLIDKGIVEKREKGSNVYYVNVRLYHLLESIN